MLALSIGVLAYFAIETRSSLCAFKHDRERQHDRSVEYVASVRAGERGLIPGLSLADIQRTIDSQEATLHALRSLKC